MCASSLTMQEWRDHFKGILERSKIEELLAGIYVDDGRNLIEILKLGMRYDRTEGKFRFDQEWERMDIEEGLSPKQRTKVRVQEAMNSINPDLQFTMELGEDFEDGRLPTLSFSLWEEPWGISHSYFEKKVRSQVLLMERSAMGTNSKFSIMSNELRRRFEVLNENVSRREKVQIIDKYTKQLVNSGYKRHQIFEIITSALKGYERKEINRKKEGKSKFRTAASTREIRSKKKLLEQITWFRNNKKDEKEKGGK